MPDTREIGRTRSGLKRGYTTGSCAAAAAKAAARMLLSGEEIRQVRLMTPKGIELYLDVERITRRRKAVKCAVQKYSGDDPDVTDGVYVFAEVGFAEAEKCLGTQEKGAYAHMPGAESREAFSCGRILLTGGGGIGRVTRAGLEQKIGQPAINKVPRKMVVEAVLEMCRKYGYEEGLRVELSIPGGERLAEKTFNPRLGIKGGLSVLGTTGIVEPMSEKALTDTIYLEMKMLRENGHSFCCVVPGNYGADFLREHLKMETDFAVKCSNYIGETIDDARLLGMKGVVLIGHAGKLVKIAAGVMNTHSRQADCRMEVLASHAAMAGADRETVRKIMGCINTAEALEILKEADLKEPVMRTVMEKIGYCLRQRAGEGLETAAVMFSLEEGILGMTENAEALLELARQEK